MVMLVVTAPGKDACHACATSSPPHRTSTALPCSSTGEQVQVRALDYE